MGLPILSPWKKLTGEKTDRYTGSKLFTKAISQGYLQARVNLHIWLYRYIMSLFDFRGVGICEISYISISVNANL